MPVRMVPAFAPAGDLGGWAVGTTPRFLPENLSWTMNKGSDFILQLHLHPTGKPEKERSTIGLYFADAPPPRKVRELSAPGLFGALANIDIPAGEKAYVVKGTARTFANMRAYSVARARALPGQGDEGDRDAAGRHDEADALDQGLGFQLAGSLRLQTAGRSAEGHED